MANPYRGEVELEVGGRTFVLRPTFQWVAEVETALGAGVPNLFFRFRNGQSRVVEAVKMLELAARAAEGGDKLPRDFGAALYAEMEVANILLKAQDLLVKAIDPPGVERGPVGDGDDGDDDGGADAGNG